jgi:hypothetical protein
VLNTIFCFLLAACTATCSFGHAIPDSKPLQTDTVEFDKQSLQDSTQVLQVDSTKVNERVFDRERLQELKDDSDLDYKVPPTVAESFWDRFWQWLADLFANLFIKSVGTNWGRLFLYIVGIVLLIFLIMMLLKVDALKMLYSGRAARLKHLVMDEDIQAMDFEQLLKDAIGANEYRRAVRLLFLYALKMLADKNHVVLESGKTNHDYLDEVKHAELKNGFKDLNFYFEYAWYGNFTITADTFRKAENIFLLWKDKLR